MEDVYALFLRPGPFIACIAAYIFTFFVGRIVHTAKPSWRAVKQAGGEGKEVIRVKKYKNTPAMWWNEVFLPAVPVIFGMGLGCVASEFLWGPALDQPVVRVMLGSGLGWFSALFYKAFRKLILKKTGIDIAPSSPADGVSVGKS